MDSLSLVSRGILIEESTELTGEDLSSDEWLIE